MWRLGTTIKPYSWGSTTAIARLCRQPAPTAEPQAELWMGAHPSGSSTLIDHEPSSLLRAIEAEPTRLLGADVEHRFGPRLPFLFKVLAAAQPLSIQAHPSAAQARTGFEREEAAGIAIDDRTRSYRDPFDKPELVCALEPFTALSGFRPIERTRRLIEWLAVPRLRALTEPLWTMPAPDAVRTTVRALLTVSQPRTIVEQVEAVCRDRAGCGEPWAEVASCAARLAAHHPGDPGMLVGLLLNRVRLEPGEALFVGPGRLHCYLEGLAVEIMGSSDNVLRGGLTTKHVDVPQLLTVLETEPVEAPVLQPTAVSPIERVYPTSADAFCLSRLAMQAGQRWSGTVSAPQIILCTAGAATLRAARYSPIALRSGDSVFVSVATDEYSIDATDSSVVFRATVGRPSALG